MFSRARRWILVSLVTVLALTGVSSSVKAAGAFDGTLGIERATYDIGLTSGRYNNIDYFEANVGLNLYFSEYLAWRNSIFGRFQDPKNYYGLDSSARGVLNLGNQDFGLGLFAGPGLRFPTIGTIAPFAEGGIVLKIKGLALGVGVRTILNSWVITGAGNDNQLFIIIGGGGSI